MWSPGPEVVTAYQAADLILLNGAGYAGWVSRVSLPEGKLIDTSASFADRYLTVAEAVTHSHGPEGEHAHEATAFTTWLDPTLALEQAGAIHAALATRGSRGWRPISPPWTRSRPVSRPARRTGPFWPPIPCTSTWRSGMA